MRKANFVSAVAFFLIIISGLTILFLSQASATIVKADYIITRATPNQTSVAIQTLKKDEKITVVEKNGEWTTLIINDQKVFALTKDIEANTIDTMRTSTQVTPVKQQVNIYKDDRTTNKTIGTLTYGQTYLKYSEKGEFSQIVFNNEIGWVETKLLKGVE